MDRAEKEAAVAEISARLGEAEAVFAVDYRGLSVPQAAELRDKLREAGASFSVVKNRLAKRATGDTGFGELDEHLAGPTAFTYVGGEGDPVLAAKAIHEFTSEYEVLAYKGGLMEGAALDPEQFKTIARLPGVDVLRGRLVGVVASPLTGVVRGLGQLISGLAVQLGQIAEQGLVGGEEPEPAAAEAEASDEAGGEEGSEEPEDEPGGEEPTTDEAGDDGEAPAAEDAPAEGEPTNQDAPAELEPAAADEPATEDPPVAEETSEADDDEPKED